MISGSAARRSRATSNRLEAEVTVVGGQPREVLAGALGEPDGTLPVALAGVIDRTAVLNKPVKQAFVVASGLEFEPAVLPGVVGGVMIVATVEDGDASPKPIAHSRPWGSRLENVTETVTAGYPAGNGDRVTPGRGRRVAGVPTAHYRLRQARDRQPLIGRNPGRVDALTGY